MLNFIAAQMPLAFIVKLEDLLPVLLTTLVFVVLGLVFFGIAFFVLNMITPFSIRKEIEEDQNTALGIVIGAMLLGIAMIIASAING